MYSSSALVAGIFALQASAFLVPLEISQAAQNVTGQIESVWTTSTHVFWLDCPGCPFVGSDRAESEWEEDVENRIQLVFDVTKDQSLRINDRPVFAAASQEALPGPLSASQVRVSDLQETAPLHVSWALRVLPAVTEHYEPKKEAYTLHFTILDLEGVPIEVDTLKIDLLRTLCDGSEPTVSILSITPIPFDTTPGADCVSDSMWSLCRIRAIFDARIQAMLEAAKMRTYGADTSMKKSGCKGGGRSIFGKHGEHRPHGAGKDHHGHHGHHDGHHHGHRHGPHHRAHRIGHMLHQTLRFFIIPALLGVIGGLMASAVGMLAGQFIVYMWTRFHRSGQRGSIRIVEQAVTEDEKHALVAEELPPQYEDIEAVIVQKEEEEH